MADLESKLLNKIDLTFSDGSQVKLEGYYASYIWLHLRNSTDLLPLLYRSPAVYIDKDYSVPLASLVAESLEYPEPITR